MKKNKVEAASKVITMSVEDYNKLLKRMEALEGKPEPEAKITSDDIKYKSKNGQMTSRQYWNILRSLAIVGGRSEAYNRVKDTVSYDTAYNIYGAVMAGNLPAKTLDIIKREWIATKPELEAAEVRRAIDKQERRMFSNYKHVKTELASMTNAHELATMSITPKNTSAELVPMAMKVKAKAARKIAGPAPMPTPASVTVASTADAVNEIRAEMSELKAMFAAFMSRK